jgi:alpha-tubulin suppressor-like RCC1 family protein
MNLLPSFSCVSEHSIFLGEDGDYRIWGSNSGKALGGGKEGVINILKIQETLVSLGCGEHHTVGVTKGGKLLCWGQNGSGQLGSHLDTNVSTPTLVELPGDEKAVSVGCGAHYTGILTASGKVFVTGDNGNGQLGLGHKNVVQSFHQVDLPPVSQIACGWSHMLALTCSGALMVWGGGEYGKLGLGDCESHMTPQLNPLTDVVSITTGASHSAAVTKDGTLYGWGWNRYGSLGLSDEEDRLTPTPIIKGGVVQVACGGNHMLLLKDTGLVYGWGWNVFGHVGIGTTETQGTPEVVKFPVQSNETDEPLYSGDPIRVVSIGCGWSHSWAVTRSGDIYLWGCHYRGGLGSQDQSRPMLFEDTKFAIPRTDAEWVMVFRWLFLGNSDHKSSFSEFPIEIVYHFVLAMFSK